MRRIRRRNNATGIYAHAIAVVLDEPDEKLIGGIPHQDIYAVAHAREARIQKGNLTTALGNIERLQVDSGGVGWCCRTPRAAFGLSTTSCFSTVLRHSALAVGGHDRGS